MKSVNIILSLLIISILCFSCDDINEPEEVKDTTRMIEKYLKPYLFRTGSYWIFENDSTRSIDSISVIETDSGSYWNPPAVHDSPGQKHEFYNIVLMNFSDSTEYNDFLNHNRISRNGGGNWGELGQPIFLADGEVGDEYNGMEIVSIISDLEINGISFSDVFKVKVTASEQYQPEFEHDTYLFYKDSIGIVKEVEILSQDIARSWSLIRWNTIF